MDHPTADAVAGQMAHLDELVDGGARHDQAGLRLAAAPRHGLARDVRDRAARHRADGLVRDPGRDRHRARLGHRRGHPLHHGRRRRRVGRPDRALRRRLHGRHHRDPARGRDRPAAHHRRHPTAGAAAGPGRDRARGCRGRHRRCGRRHLRWPAPARHAPQGRRGRRLGAVRRRRRSRGRRDPGRAGQRARVRACGPARHPRAGDHRPQRGSSGCRPVALVADRRSGAAGRLRPGHGRGHHHRDRARQGPLRRDADLRLLRDPRRARPGQPRALAPEAPLGAAPGRQSVRASPAIWRRTTPGAGRTCSVACWHP